MKLFSGLSKLTSQLAPPAVIPTISPALQQLGPVMQSLGPLGIQPSQLGLVPPPGIAIPTPGFRQPTPIVPGQVGMLPAPSVVTPVLSQPVAGSTNAQEALRRAQEQAQVIKFLSYYHNILDVVDKEMNFEMKRFSI